MPRKDRSYTADDIFRIYCNNLDPYEKVFTRWRIIFQACEDSNCGHIQTLLNILKPLCLFADTPISKAVQWIPYIGKTITQLVDLACEAEPYIQMGYDIACSDAPGSPALKAIDNNISAVLIPLIRPLQDEIADLLAQDQQLYLEYSTLSNVMI